MCAPKTLLSILVLMISTNALSSLGQRRSQIFEQEINGLKENLTALWDVLGQMQSQLERLEQQEKVHHHHHHYHHRYFIDSNNETTEEVNGTHDPRLVFEHEVNYEKEMFQTDGEHHQHHHEIHHHHAKQPNETAQNKNTNRCNGNGNGNGNGVLLDEDNENVLAKAICHIRPNRALPANARQNIRGTVHFRQKAHALILGISLRGFVTTPDHAHPDQHEKIANNKNIHVHGVHVHEYGDLSNGCESAGEHYNPLGSPHGGPSSPARHVGDFGNIECDNQGKLDIRIVDEVASLTGTYSIIGKTLVIHESPDDYGLNTESEYSAINGNSGRRLACCVITTHTE